MNAGHWERFFDGRARSLDHYAAEKPALDLRSYLDGPVQASGAMFGPRNRLRFRFCVEMSGTWKGPVGTLAERFTYSDGARSERVWQIVFGRDGQFRATADDVVGEAAGRQAGNAAVMHYRLRVPRGRRSLVLTMEDWLFLMPDGILINRTRMSKFGLKFGELVLAFRKGMAPGGDWL